MKRIGGLVVEVMGAIALMLLSLPSCSSVTPHENFKEFLKANVGKSVDDPSSDVSRYPQLLIGRRVLQDGNIENGYRWRGVCRYFLEYDPKTRIIVGWRFEGNEQDCEIVP